MADKSWKTRSAAAFRRHIWNAEALKAVALASPAILATAGSLLMAISLDRRIAHLNSRRDALTASMARLDEFTRHVESLQLGRGALLLVMTSGDQELKLRYALDRLFRLNAMGSMRRMAATVDPAGWKARIATYERIVAQDYDKPDTVQELQALESGLVAEASRELTLGQGVLNETLAKIDRFTNLKNAMLIAGNALTYILTMLVFFARVQPRVSQRPDAGPGA